MFDVVLSFYVQKVMGTKADAKISGEWSVIPEQFTICREKHNGKNS